MWRSDGSKRAIRSAATSAVQLRKEAHQRSREPSGHLRHRIDHGSWRERADFDSATSQQGRSTWTQFLQAWIDVGLSRDASQGLKVAEARVKACVANKS